MLLRRLPAARSTTSSVLFSRAATKRQCPFASMARWSMRPLTPGSGMVLVSLSAAGSWAGTHKAREQSRNMGSDVRASPVATPIGPITINCRSRRKEAMIFSERIMSLLTLAALRACRSGSAPPSILESQDAIHACIGKTDRSSEGDSALISPGRIVLLALNVVMARNGGTTIFKNIAQGFKALHGLGFPIRERFES